MCDNILNYMTQACVFYDCYFFACSEFCFVCVAACIIVIACDIVFPQIFRNTHILMPLYHHIEAALCRFLFNTLPYPLNEIEFLVCTLNAFYCVCRGVFPCCYFVSFNMDAVLQWN